MTEDVDRWTLRLPHGIPGNHIGISDIYRPLSRMLITGTHCYFHKEEGSGPYLSSLLEILRAERCSAFNRWFFFFQQPIYRLLSKLNVPECLLLQELVMVTLPMHFSPLTIQLRTSCCLQLFFSCFCFFVLHLFFAFIFKTVLPDWGYILRRHSLKSLPSEKNTGHANSRCSIKCCWIQWN